MLNDEAVNAIIRAQLDDALEIAVEAKAQFQTKPMVTSQRGGPRVSPWFRVWDLAEQNVARLARLLTGKPVKAKSLDDELKNLLEDR